MSVRSLLSFNYHLFKLFRKYPFPQQCKVIVDYISLYKAKGLTFDEYYNYHFEDQDESFRESFLGRREEQYYLDLLNPIKYYSLARNKYLAHLVMEKTGIRTSTLYCYYHPEGSITDSDVIATNVVDVCRILKQKEVSQCVIKSTEDSHGNNVLVVANIEYIENDCILHYFNGKIAKLSEDIGKSPRLFESVIRQTDQFTKINASSVNTVRMMTTLYPDGSAKAIAAFFRSGREGNCVDNAGNGGNVDACVDVSTGELKFAVQFDGWRKVKEIEKHPDSGSQLNGVFIENWNYILDEVIKYQKAFPWCKAAGWDIAITDKGPMVIEVNDCWDCTGQLFIRQGWRNEIRSCYFAWKEDGYKANCGRINRDWPTKKCFNKFEK